MNRLHDKIKDDSKAELKLDYDLKVKIDKNKFKEIEKMTVPFIVMKEKMKNENDKGLNRKIKQAEKDLKMMKK